MHLGRFLFGMTHRLRHECSPCHVAVSCGKHIQSGFPERRGLRARRGGAYGGTRLPRGRRRSFGLAHGERMSTLTATATTARGKTNVPSGGRDRQIESSLCLPCGLLSRCSFVVHLSFASYAHAVKLLPSTVRKCSVSCVDVHFVITAIFHSSDRKSTYTFPLASTSQSCFLGLTCDVLRWYSEGRIPHLPPDVPTPSLFLCPSLDTHVRALASRIHLKSGHGSHTPCREEARA